MAGQVRAAQGANGCGDLQKHADADIGKSFLDIGRSRAG